MTFGLAPDELDLATHASSIKNQERRYESLSSYLGRERQDMIVYQDRISSHCKENRHRFSNGAKADMARCLPPTYRDVMRPFITPNTICLSSSVERLSAMAKKARGVTFVEASACKGGSFQKKKSSLARARPFKRAALACINTSTESVQLSPISIEGKGAGTS